MGYEFNGEIPRRLAVAGNTGQGWRYELWRTPELKPGWHLYGYLNGVRVSRKPMISELRGRKEFEKQVEAHSA